MKKIYLLAVLSAIFLANAQAQTVTESASRLSKGIVADTSYGHVVSWPEMMQDPNYNFYDVQASFNAYWTANKAVKEKGYKPYLRWEALMAPRVYPTGERKVSQDEVMDRYKAFESQYKAVQGNDGTKSQTGLGQA